MHAQPATTWIAAAVLAAVIVVAAYRMRSLTPSGAVAALVLGTALVGTGGWWPGVALVTFFATSSALGKLRPGTSLEQARGNRRDWVQVIANGAVPLASGVAFGITGWDPWLLGAFGGIAAATADTWSSELGRTSPSPPRLITTMRVARAGTSGAVSARGLAASLAGGALIGAIALAAAVASPWQAVAIAAAGLGGSLVDSLLGATLQERRWCAACNMPTEANPHRCGSPTHIVGGIPEFTNDTVNALCIIFGALFAVLSGII